MPHVFHPTYAPTHPCQASDEELPTLLKQGWHTSREAMLSGAPSTPAPIAETPAASDTSDDDVDRMLAEESDDASDATDTKKNSRKKTRK